MLVRNKQKPDFLARVMKSLKKLLCFSTAKQTFVAGKQATYFASIPPVAYMHLSLWSQILLVTREIITAWYLQNMNIVLVQIMRKKL